MKVNFNKLLKDLDGREIPHGNAGKVIANVLVSQTKGDAVKYWGWAQKLHDGKEMELDKSDFDTLKNFIKDSEVLPVLTKAQVLEIMGDFKED